MDSENNQDICNTENIENAENDNEKKPAKIKFIFAIIPILLILLVVFSLIFIWISYNRVKQENRTPVPIYTKIDDSRYHFVDPVYQNMSMS
jgi:flagellar basal body-associated protein FliL